MTTATKPGAPFQGPSWAEAIADPTTLGHAHTIRGQKDFSEELHPRDDHGRFTDGGGDISTAFGSHRDDKWEYDARDTAQQRAALKDNRVARGNRAEFPSGTRIVSVGSRSQPVEKARGNVDRTLPGRDSLGGAIRITWDNGFSGVSTVTGIVRADEWDEFVAAGGAKDFSEELHPRDDHGRFTDTGSLGDTAITSGGFSLSLAGDRPTSGWMVSQLGSERSFSIEQLSSGQSMSFVPGNPWHDNFTNEVDRFVKDNVDDLKQPGAYLGGWVDSGRLFLDVSHNFADEGEARQFAQANQQFAMFNAGTGEYVSFDQERQAQAAAREAADEKAAAKAKENEKVLLKVDPAENAESIASRLHRALFG